MLDQRALLPSTTGGEPNQQHSCGSQDLGPRIATPLQDRDKGIPEAAESYGQPEAPFDVSVMCIYIYIEENLEGGSMVLRKTWMERPNRSKSIQKVTKSSAAFPQYEKLNPK